MWISRNLKKGSIWEKRNGGFFTFLCITGSFSDTLLCTEWFVQLGFCVREGTTFFGVRLSSFFFFFCFVLCLFFFIGLFTFPESRSILCYGTSASARSLWVTFTNLTLKIEKCLFPLNLPAIAAVAISRKYGNLCPGLRSLLVILSSCHRSLFVGQPSQPE